MSVCNLEGGDEKVLQEGSSLPPLDFMKEDPVLVPGCSRAALLQQRGGSQICQPDLLSPFQLQQLCDHQVKTAGMKSPETK